MSPSGITQGGATTGQVLQWNGTVWTPATITSSGGVTITGVAPIAVNAGAVSLQQGGATTGQALVWNGSAWGPGTVSGGSSTPISGLIIDGSTIPASTSSPYQMATADRAVVINKTTGAATQILLPTNPTLWVDYKIKDGKGDANTNNITVGFAGSGTIDGQTTFLLNVQNDGLTVFASNATTWWVA